MSRRLVIIAASWNRDGGLEIATQDFTAVFRRLGFDVTVLTARGWEADILEKDFKVLHFEPRSRIMRSIWHRWWRYRKLAAVATSVLRAGDMLLVAHSYLLDTCKYIRLPKDVTTWLWTHGVDAWGNDGRHIAALQKYLTRVIAVSHYTANEERRQGVAIPISIIPNSVDTDRFTPDFDYSLVRRDEILISSRTTVDTKNKGHDVLFAAVPIIEQKLGRKVHVRVIGKGDNLESLKSLAEAICPGRVEFCGRVSNEALLEAYRHCACFCMPSRVEHDLKPERWRGDGFGIVYAEVQACGRPAVGSIEGGAVDPILEGKTGFKVDPRNVEAVAVAVAKLLASPELSDQMGRSARAFVCANFTREALENRIKEALSADKPDVVR